MVLMYSVSPASPRAAIFAGVERNPEDPANLFRIAIAFEQRAAKFFAERGAHAPEGSAERQLYKELAAEEREHVEILTTEYGRWQRGRAGLQANRAELCELLWRLWSPTLRFDAATYARTAAAFDNPDFVDVVIHSYRHRFGLVPGDPTVAGIESRLALQPPITVPAITLDGADDGVMPIGGSAAHAHHFTGPHVHRVVPGAGHNLPQEQPDAFARAVLDLLRPETLDLP